VMHSDCQGLVTDTGIVQNSSTALCRRKQQAEATRAQADVARAAAHAQAGPSGGSHGGANGAQARAAALSRREEAAARWKEEKAKEKEAELIRQNYLGKKHEKRKITKASDKNKCAAWCFMQFLQTPCLPSRSLLCPFASASVLSSSAR
jgi:hypothetical protein